MNDKKLRIRRDCRIRSIMRCFYIVNLCCDCFTFTADAHKHFLLSSTNQRQAQHDKATFQRSCFSFSTCKQFYFELFLCEVCGKDPIVQYNTVNVAFCVRNSLHHSSQTLLRQFLSHLCSFLDCNIPFSMPNFSHLIPI